MFLDDGFFGGMPIIAGIIFLIVISTIIFIIIKNVTQGIKNSNSPILTELAQVVTKRTVVSGENSYTSNYVTFERQNGERIEFSVKGQEYGVLADGDYGSLTFQGTRYHSFERQKKPL